MTTATKTRCMECGALAAPAEYHPYAYCVLWKAGIDPKEFIAAEIDRRVIEDDLLTAAPPVEERGVTR